MTNTTHKPMRTVARKADVEFLDEFVENGKRITIWVAPCIDPNFSSLELDIVYEIAGILAEQGVGPRMFGSKSGWYEYADHQATRWRESLFGPQDEPVFRQVWYEYMYRIIDLAQKDEKTKEIKVVVFLRTEEYSTDFDVVYEVSTL